MAKLIASILLLLFATLIISCASQPEDQNGLNPESGTLQVVFAIYSGRPDPVWNITNSNTINIIRGKIKDLPTLTEQQKLLLKQPGLGEGYFIIINQNVSDFPQGIYIGNEVINIWVDKEKMYFEDKNDLYGYLLQLALEQELVPPQIKEWMEQSMKEQGLWKKIDSLGKWHY